jgi:hypothetical protein
MVKITTSKIEEMILNKIKEKGIPDSEISEETINKIKDKIKQEVNKTKPATEDKEDIVLNVSQETPTETPGEAPSPVSTTTEVNPETEQIYKKEGEVEEKEEELKNKEIELQQKEEELIQKAAELNRKEEELAYKPKMPVFLNNFGTEKMFIFDTNQISVGGEKLSQTPFNLILNPDVKKTMNDVWIEQGKKCAELFLVKFEKIGNISFNPFDGTSKFEEKKDEVESLNSIYNKPEENIQPMEDSIEPIKSVTLPLKNNNEPETSEVGKIDDILRDYFAKNQI